MSLTPRSRFGRFVHHAYMELIGDRERHAPFWVLIAFLVTFVTARFLVHSDPALYFRIGRTHVHHFTWGILLLSIVGYLALVMRSRRARTVLAIIYGVGLGLVFDEFGLWLNLNPNYLNRQSYDALLILTIVLVNLVYFSDFWLRLLRFRLSGEQFPEERM